MNTKDQKASPTVSGSDNEILTCPGAGCFQAFRLGSSLIGRGATEDLARIDLHHKECARHGIAPLSDAGFLATQPKGAN